MTLLEFEVGLWTFIAGYGLIISTLNLLDVSIDRRAREKENRNGLLLLIAEYSERSEATRWVQQFGLFMAGLLYYIPLSAVTKGIATFLALFTSSIGLVLNTRRARKFREEMGYESLRMRDVPVLIKRTWRNWRRMRQSKKEQKRAT